MMRGDDAADEAGEQADERAFGGVIWQRRVLLAQVDRQHTARDDPQAATAVAQR